MRIAVSGSIATDHLMAFPGSFTEQLIEDSLDRISLSFLVDELEIRHGGVAANISYGLGSLGLAPVLVGAAGGDFGAYRVRLKEAGVDTDSVLLSTVRQTARFVCLTDREQNQIASFYAGAMAEAPDIDLRRIADRVPDLGIVVISPNDPAAMLRHTAEARALGIPFAADPSQQLARIDRDEARELVTGARWLFSNAYEASLLRERTGWGRADILSRVGVWLTTLGAQGVRIERAGEPPRTVPAVPPSGAVEPTGAGDAFRAGFLAAVSWGEDLRAAARLGCAVASFSLEGRGAQGYALAPDALAGRLADTYGGAPTASLSRRLRSPLSRR
ncbi:MULTISPECIES: carbohydrate kinase family protein [unclassified Streptomyces]|uniref:carbohydrate kinase family protein n=1 Tax=unclassified Streptomyces TaxID=2593676 RepID=UPI002E327C29|nr:carbohydrate kinase family protein [Streptomyces sp. NBC_01268]